ncbi:MAG: hypothetical protein DBY30_01335 [Verrucomicrobia bacterium]|nr:MAG: hypothetical protein DBY30_01335 [Verrucomicrobiota bacterium]
MAKGAKPGGGGCGRQFSVGANFAVEYKFGVGEFWRIAPVFRLAYLDTDGGASCRRTVCGRAPTCAATPDTRGRWGWRKNIAQKKRREVMVASRR